MFAISLGTESTFVYSANIHITPRRSNADLGVKEQPPASKEGSWVDQVPGMVDGRQDTKCHFGDGGGGGAGADSEFENSLFLNKY